MARAGANTQSSAPPVRRKQLQLLVLEHSSRGSAFPAHLFGHFEAQAVGLEVPLGPLLPGVIRQLLEGGACKHFLQGFPELEVASQLQIAPTEAGRFQTLNSPDRADDEHIARRRRLIDDKVHFCLQKVGGVKLIKQYTFYCILSISVPESELVRPLCVI